MTCSPKIISLLLVVCALTGSGGGRASAAPLPNGGFERAAAQSETAVNGWTPYGEGYAVDTQVRHGGSRSLRCETTAGGRTTGAFYTWNVGQSRTLPIMVSGWSKAIDVDGVADNDYAIYLDITYSDGSALWGQTAPFDTGTHDWRRKQLMLFPSKPIRSMNVYALFRNHTGKVWFDDFDAHEVTSDTLFDGQNIAPPVLPKGETSGWFVRDVAANGPLMPLASGKSALGVQLDTAKNARLGKLVEATVRNLTPRDRALTVYYVERFDAAKPVWWNHIRDAVPATESREYGNLTQAGAGATGQLSVYPFGCVTGQGTGRVLATPPGLGPRIARIAFRPDTHLFFLAYDLALTARGDTAKHDQAPVTVARYNVNPDWGFRDASAQYYALFPDAFKRRAKAEGIWIPFTSPQFVTGLDDFHIAYHEGDNSIATDRASKILSFRYVEPMTYWMPMAKGVPRTYDVALDMVRKLAVGKDQVAARQAQAVLSSGSKDMHGKFNVAFRDTPWCDGAVWVLNPNPGMTSAEGLWTKARLNQDAAPAPGKAKEPDGEYLDSLEAWADVLDYRPESLRASRYALCYAMGDSHPALPTWFSVYESTAALSANLHRRGKLLMANTVPWRFSTFASLIDVMGTETNMFTETGAWAPESDAIMNLRRTMSYHKPYLVLLNADFTKVDSAGIERYMQRCMFYGVYPSTFSVNAADHPYWENAELYNRDRPLFKKYIPVVQRLSAAGWEPITWAQSGRSDVWLERYGSMYLTTLNSADAEVTAEVRIDAAHFITGVPIQGKSLVVRDVLSGEILSAKFEGGTLSIPVTLKAQQTRVLSVQVAGDRAASILEEKKVAN